MTNDLTIVINTVQEEDIYLEQSNLSEVLNLSVSNAQDKLYPKKSELVELSNLMTGYVSNNLYPITSELSQILILYSSLIVNDIYLDRSDLPKALTLIFDNVIDELIIEKSESPETLPLTDRLGYKVGKIYVNEETIEYDYTPIYKTQIDALAGKLKRGDLYSDERGKYKVVIIANNTNITLDLSSPFSFARRYF